MKNSIKNNKMKNTMTIAKAKQTIKDVPYNDSIIERWLEDDRMISQWITAAEGLKNTIPVNKAKGMDIETIVEAYEAEYRNIAANQGVSFNYYVPIFFLAGDEIKGRFIANQFLRDMKVVKFAK
jgi:hypothetical protein